MWHSLSKKLTDVCPNTYVWYIEGAWYMLYELVNKLRLNDSLINLFMLS